MRNRHLAPRAHYLAFLYSLCSRPIKSGICLGSIFLTCLFAPCLEPSQQVAPNSERLRELVASEYDHAISPYDPWPDLSAHTLRSTEEHDQSILKQLQNIPREQLPNADRLAYDFFAWQTERHLAQFQCRLYLTPFWNDDRFTSWRGLLGAAAQVWTRTPAKSVADAQKLIRRWEQAPAYLEQITALLREAKSRRMLPAKDSVQPDLASLLALLRPLNSSRAIAPNLFDAQPNQPIALETELLQSLSLPPDTSIEDSKPIFEAAHIAIRKNVLPAVQKYRDFLVTEYAPACPDFFSLHDWPDGERVYSELNRRFTTTRLDPEQLHQLGLREVARIRAAFEVVIHKARFQSSLDEFLTTLRTNPRFYYKTQDQLLAAYQTTFNRIQTLTSRVVHQLPAAVPSIERSGGQVGAMFRPPPYQTSSGGAILVSVGSPDIHPTLEIIPLLLHEGWPGHALQYAIDRESRSSRSALLLNLQDHTSEHGAFSEGWGLYAESLGHDMDLYGDPYDEAGELRMQLTRAVRVVIDTGIHRYGWSQSKSKAYFLAQTGKPQEEIDAEVKRTAQPGTGLAYTIGQQQFLRLRNLALQKLGPQFNLRSFHDVILRWGPIPFEALGKGLADCLTEPACAAAFKS